MPDDSIWAVILAGGVGSRFWPVSTSTRPKQLLPLGSDRPLIADTVSRIEPVVPLERLRVLTSEYLAELIRDRVPELGAEQFLIEPHARGTAPVLAWAASEISRRDPNAIMISLHADHVIEPADAFRSLLGDIGHLAREYDRLFTIGIQPTRPETGYGYIHVGDRLGPALDAYDVADFVEKPDRATAHEYLRRKTYLWNSGIFVWRASLFMDEVRKRAPEMASALDRLEADDVEGYFETVPRLSVDEGVLERSPHVAVARATFEWDDVGAWDAIGRTRECDDAGNVRVGSVHAVDSKDCVAWAEDGHIVIFGTEAMVVVRSGDITLVVPRDRAPDLKTLIRELPPELLDASDGGGEPGG